MSLLIVFHSLYSLAGGVDNRLSTLEINLSENINREYLLFKDNVDLPHVGKVRIMKSIFIPKIVLKNKKNLKLFAYFYGIINFFYRVYQTRRYIKKNSFKTLFAVDDYFALISIIASIGLNKKIVCSVRNNWDELYNKTMIHLLPDFVYKKILPKLMNKYCSHVHCVSKSLATKLTDQYSIQNTIAIYNIFDIQNIIEKSKESISLNYSYLINIGHFNQQKNQKELILAFSKLKKEYDIKEKLVFIGEGPLLSSCKLLVNELSLEEEVIFLGQQLNPYKYLRKAKLYVSSSLYEGLPAVFVESLILDIPIVSYNFETGSKELTSNLSEMTPQNLAIHIYKLLNDKELFLKSIRKGQDIIKEEFNKEVIMRKWMKIL